MKKTLVVASLFLYSAYVNAQSQTVAFPVAEKKAHWRTVQGDSTLDNYYWMYDYFGKGPDSTEVVDYLKAENAYLDTMMSDTKKIAGRSLYRNEKQE